MLRINDDSEEVFRRAADAYPLKTDNADWDAVFTKMQETPPSDDNEGPVKKRDYRRFLLLLLLLIALGVVEYKYQVIRGKGRSATISQRSQNGSDGNQEQGKIVGAEKKNTEGDVANTNAAGILSPNNKKQAGDVNNVSSEQAQPGVKNSGGEGPDELSTTPDANRVTADPVDKATSNKINNVDGANSQREPGGRSKKNKTAGKQHMTIHTETADAEGSTAVVPPGRKNKKAIAVNNSEENISAATPKKTIKSKQKTAIKIQAAETAEDETAGSTETKNSTVAQEIQPAPVEAVASSVKSEEIVAANVVVDSTRKMDKEVAATTKKKENEEQKKKQKHIYIGALAGPDFSTIKLQSVKKTGLNYGFIAGYRFNKKISIETGIFKDKKMYSSQGKYFSTKNIPTYPGSTIDYVSGECHMFEVPLNINYAFSNRKNTSWFLSTGVSAYFMQKESYVFDVNYNGYSYPYAADYKSHDNKILAVINISAGYTHKLGRICDLRIQPYLKIPVSKLGTGELPIQSAGILIGLTKDIF